MPASEVAAVRLAPPRQVWSIADGWWIGSAVAVWWAAALAPALPMLAGVAGLAALVVTRWPLLLVVALAVLGAARASDTIGALAGAEGGPRAGRAEVASDPEWVRSALRLDLVIDGVRWEAWARGGSAGRLARASVGEIYAVELDATLADGRDRDFLWPRGAAGRAQIAQVRRIDGGALHHRTANAIRGLVIRSVEGLSQRDGILVTGFVLGDDRGQLPEVVDDFRGSGLTHLLAVSGSNVATVLVMAAPLLRRLPQRWRLVAVLGLLAEFAVVTRGEPSVLRACALAAIATAASTFGRRASPLRLLSIAVSALVLADPLLVQSVGFQLSVSASAGIAMLARPLAGLLPGPRPLAETVAVTLAAQLAVMPVQVTTFGSLPLASIPANVLAAPAAAPAMIWGLHAGLIGGFAGSPIASFVHQPTRLAVGWVAGVAQYSTALDLPTVESAEIPWAVAVLMISVVLAWVTGWRGAVVVFAALGMLVVSDREVAPLPSGAHLAVVSVQPTVVVIDRPEPAWALGQLREAGVRSIDVLVLRSGSRDAESAARALRSRLAVGEVWAPRALPSVDAQRVERPVDLGVVVVETDGSRLRVGRPG